MKTIDEMVFMVVERGGFENMPHFTLGTTFVSHLFKFAVNGGVLESIRLSTPVGYIEPGRIMATTIKGKNTQHF